jgi:hypothetical protein
MFVRWNERIAKDMEQRIIWRPEPALFEFEIKTSRGQCDPVPF